MVRSTIRASIILMDSGANISIINTKLARKVVKAAEFQTDRLLKIQGLSQSVGASMRAEVKITLGWKVAYLFEVWIGEKTGGYDAILGTDFMMCAGIVLDMCRGRMRLPDEVVIPLTHRSSPALSIPWVRKEIKLRHPSVIPSLDSAEFPLQRTKAHDMVLWVTDYKNVYPTVSHDSKERIRSIELTNTANSPTVLPAFTCIGMWVSAGHLPDKEGFVRIGSHKYEEWQKLVSRTRSLLKLIIELWWKLLW
jgi:hypothetical protein